MADLLKLMHLEAEMNKRRDDMTVEEFSDVARRMVIAEFGLFAAREVFAEGVAFGIVLPTGKLAPNDMKIGDIVKQYGENVIPITPKL